MVKFPKEFQIKTNQPIHFVFGESDSIKSSIFAANLISTIACLLTAIGLLGLERPPGDSFQ
jgi:hypothetical protein